METRPDRIELGAGTGSDSRREVGTSLLLGFVALALVALATVPVVLGRQVAEIEGSIRDRLEPAQRLATDYAIAQVRGMARVQGFLLSSDAVQRRRFADEYGTGMARADSIYAELRAITEDMNLGIQGQVVELFNRSNEWTVHHLTVLTGEVSTEEFEPELPTEQVLYDNLLRSVNGLRQGLDLQIQVARARVAQAERLRLRITYALVVTALVATLAIGIVARRLRGLAREADRRRMDAVGSRREADALLAGTADGVLGVDLDGSCMFLNRAGAELIGIDPGEAFGTPFHHLLRHVGADGVARVPEETPVGRAHAAGGLTSTYEAVFERFDGSRFPVRVSTRPMVDGRIVRGLVISFVDMTETRAAEQGLRQALRARDEVVGVVSHDLRNPVGTIHMAAELLLDLPLPPDKQRDQFELIQRQARNMERLIQDLLDITRIEADGLSLMPRPEPIDSVLEEAVDQAESRAARRGIRLESELEPGLPMVRADRHRILQVLWNLIGNALKFTPDGGSVTVRASRRDRTVLLEVADTGQGIAPEDQPHIFNRFWQVRSSGRGGSGLGLAIVKGIVEAHRGQVWVTSEPGVGSTFSFTLPAVEADGGPAPDAVPEATERLASADEPSRAP